MRSTFSCWLSIWENVLLRTYFTLLIAVLIALITTTRAVDILMIPAEKLRPSPAPAFPTAAPPAPRYPLYPYIVIPKPPKNPCARMEGDDCRTGCCYPGLVCSRKLGRCASIFHLKDFELGLKNLPTYAIQLEG